MNKKPVYLGVGIVALLVLWSGISIYPNWLWFKNLGFSPIYWTMLFSQFGFGILAGLCLILIVVLNVFFAKRLKTSGGSNVVVEGGQNPLAQLGLSPPVFNALFVVIVLALSYIVGSSGSRQWDMLMRFLYQQPFGSTDPIFQKEIGFYLFSLPFYTFVQNGLLTLVVLAAVVTIAWYLKEGAVQVSGELKQNADGSTSLPEISIDPNVKKHLVFLGGVLILVLAWGFYLTIYGLLYSIQGPAFGASYTDVKVKIAVYWVLVVLSVVFAGILFYNTFDFKKKLVWISGVTWIGAVLILATLLPMVVQQFVVKPNELAKESEYIAYNIDFTRKAHNLSRIKQVDFAVKDKLNVDDLKKQNATIQNIRIWDERPLLQTYRQIQTIRLYYDFNHVDVDRYMINDQYRQIMLAARELVVDQLPAQANTWVNRHLIYTHGYGLAASPVNEVTGEGLPRLFIKDLPPSYEDDLRIERPEIYYGEKTDEYVLVNTDAKEFDYPKGDKNIYSVYQGLGGGPINSFFRRLLFAKEFLDPQILFTGYLTPKSRIMYHRQIRTRTRMIAPFLDYDADPYLVVSQGKLYWMQDAYTTSDMYPYSTRSYGRFGNKGINYIRNSVKITIDAYNGDMGFYITDEQDPIVKTYASIFPKLFKPLNEMPNDLKKHIRYPKDLFKIQVDTYTKYHMEDVQVFYNQEDLWQIPDELYGESRQEMEPYYIIVKLPETEKEEFFLMLPFTPSEKDNMIGWLAAKCDMPDYGNLIVYKLPKDKLVYGPMQIEARVDQQTEISRELSLWGQGGSRVIRGNLLAIPVSDTFIYVEPVYLEATQEGGDAKAAAAPQPRGFGFGKRDDRAPRRDRSKSAALPELKRIIVAFGNQLVMEENLDKALSSLLGMQVTTQPTTSPTTAKAQDIHALGAQGLEHYNKAKSYLRQGAWADYGRELNNLETVLKKISTLKNSK
ncbi:MAG: UPF0182 family protein [Proteobacteria bacterium]|nr:UPF0182 family protein [Pseudomonadota bacterium]